MICPYCGKEMKGGEICAGRSRVVWRPACGAFTLPPGLAISPELLGPTAENGFCMECGVLIVRPNSKNAAEFREKYQRYLEKKGEI